MLIDPGTPYEHGAEPEAKPAGKSATEQRLEQIERDLAEARRTADTERANAQFWARKAASKEPTVVVTQPEPEETRELVPELVEKPEALLDDMSKAGLNALKARGLITADQLRQVLEENNQRNQAATEERIQQVRAEAEFQGRLASEFPEVAEDSARMDKGLPAKSPLFIRAAEIYRENIALDPALDGSKGALLIACRQAKAELDAKGRGGKKPADEVDDEPRRERPSRRERIARQAPERSVDADESSSEPEYGKQQLEVMGRLGVKPEEFARHATRSRNGR